MFEKQINHFKANVDIKLAIVEHNYAWLAREIGFTQQSLRGILNHGRPQQKTLRKFAFVFECDPNDLIEHVSYEEYGKHRIPRH